MRQDALNLGLAALLWAAAALAGAAEQALVTDSLSVAADTTCTGSGAQCYCQPTGLSPRTAYELRLVLSLPPRSTGAGPFPLVLFLHGFGGPRILNSADYSVYAATAAAAGFALLQYDIAAGGGWLGVAPDPVELQFVPALLAWAERANATGGTPAAGRLDLGWLAVAGHSRGGKLAALAYAAPTSRFQAAFLVDPVECTCQAPCSSNCFPPAAAALAAAGRPLAALGAAVRGCCNPRTGDACGALCAAGCYAASGNMTCPGNAYQDFAAAAGAGSRTLTQAAGHMQFATLPPAEQWLADRVCGADAGATSQAVCAAAAGHMVDWLRSQLQAVPSLEQAA